jgi:hypothetical protein
MFWGVDVEEDYKIEKKKKLKKSLISLFITIYNLFIFVKIK